MIRETSYGVIPLRNLKKRWELLLICHRKGNYWAFPKGHNNPGETPQDAASRELMEETGLSIKRILSPRTLNESYEFYRTSQRIHKTVVYFLAEVEGTLTLQTEEITKAQWFLLEEAEAHITFVESRTILRQVLRELDFEFNNYNKG
jgi:bis(5'-nucleosidyl)-tetraphosphatase